jgi:FG-GAP-like repeat
MRITQRLAAFSAVLALCPVAISAHAAADDDTPRPGEGGRDIATPGPLADLQANRKLDADTEARINAAPLGAQPGIDDFRYDDLVTVGTAAEVCYGSLRTGTLAAYQALVARFGGTPGTMYYCRERYATFERPECDGQIADPATMPDFFSDCWSNHAQGRAFDIMVGTSGGGYDQARGNAIVNFLLAPDAAGNQNANARRLGVQQILWNDRCWNSDGDRGVSSATAMRVCGYGHFDHVHVDLTLDGSDGHTSWWGSQPRQDPKLNSIWFQDAQSGSWAWRSLVNLGAVSGRGGSHPARYTKFLSGDWNADGVDNEIFAFDQSTGDYIVYDGSSGRVLRAGRASPTIDQFVNGDFDDDGRMNDMILYDTETGYGTLWTWTPSGPLGRSEWSWGGNWEKLVALDGNSDGRVDEALIYDRDTGVWYVFTFDAGPPILLNANRIEAGWDDLVAGDLDSQGNRDDLFLRDKESGIWVVLNWYDQDAQQAIPRASASGQWSTDWDRFVMGDWDTDGHVDDMYLYDTDSGRWQIMSWHRYVPTHVEAASDSPGLDNLVSGTFEPPTTDGRADVALRYGTAGGWVWDVGVSTGSGFRSAGNWSWGRGGTPEPVYRGDFDGDGRTDVLLRYNTGSSWAWDVGLSTGNGFRSAGNWSWGRGGTPEPVYTGDFDGDGRTDVLLRYNTGSSWAWDVGLSTGSGFRSAGNWSWGRGGTAEPVSTGDFDGDGRTDVLLRYSNGSTWFWDVGLSTGSGFRPAGNWSWGRGGTPEPVYTGDLDGDGRTDVLLRYNTANGWVWDVGLSTGSGFRPAGNWSWGRGGTPEPVYTGDLDGDGRTDVLLRYNTANGWVWDVGLSTGSGLRPAGNWSWGRGGTPEPVYTGDLG